MIVKRTSNLINQVQLYKSWKEQYDIDIKAVKYMFSGLKNLYLEFGKHLRNNGLPLCL